MQIDQATTRRLLLAGALVAGAGAGIGIAVASSSGTSAPKAVAPPPMRADETWPAGARRAAGFRLRDQHGAPISLDALRGRPTVVTFLDPVCRNLCPIEARALGAVVRRLGAQAPNVVAVSVNPGADTVANFRSDAREWRLPATWRWATGSHAALARVWHAYRIAVQVQTKRLAGVTVHEVAHTEEAYVIDAHGFQRALFLFPFRAADVERTIRSLR
jgi:cytochrome oxidase Cu insertion factor (SCO1/SenC/PrrC family)